MSLSAERRRLLIQLERIVGNSCYNGNIQNYGPGGYQEPEGRWFRYPVRFPGKETRYTSVPNTISDKDMLGAYYALGANRLNIMNALNEILTLLEKDYRLNIDAPEDADS